MADSRDVAAFFGKDHKNVLQSIRNMSCPDHFRSLNFQPFVVKDLTGESTSHVMMTKDGFLFRRWVTGPKAAAFKVQYIEQFNVMEAELRAPRAAGGSPRSEGNYHPARCPPRNAQGAPWSSRSSKRGTIAAQGAQIASMTADVETLDRIAKADGSLCLTDAAKTAGSFWT